MNEDSRGGGQLKLEEMRAFFTSRLDGYEEHMLTDIGRAAYRKMADLVPENTRSILDLGCGTGLELDEIFRRLPSVSVTAIDLTQPMLDILKVKHPEKNLKVICGDYFKIDFKEDTYDAAVSSQTLHHFSHEMKLGLYRKIFHALKPEGVYIECDYMVEKQSVEDELYAVNTRLRRELGIDEGEYCHFDTPCTIENQVSMLTQAGFSAMTLEFRMENTTILKARKHKSQEG